MVKKLLYISLAALALMAGRSFAGTCSYGGAHYVLDGDPNIQASFKTIPRYDGWLSDVALEITANNGRNKLWFLFDQGNSPHINMISTTDMDVKDWSPPSHDGGKRPYGETQYLSANKNYKFLADTVPQSTQTAPDKILIPDLSNILFMAYRRGDVRHAFFELKSCK